MICRIHFQEFFSKKEYKNLQKCSNLTNSNDFAMIYQKLINL